MFRKGFMLCAVVASAFLAACSEDSAPRKECVDSSGVGHQIGADLLCCSDGTGVAESDANCGRCGNVCSNGNHCVSGECVCAGTGEYCSLTCTDTACVDLKADVNNCGRVGNKCDAGKVCSLGECSASCGSGLENCNGSCRDTNTDENNCGGCGKVCPGKDAAKHIASGACSSRSCSIICENGWQDADGDMSNGCEKAFVNTESDVNNCGEVGHVCPQTDASLHIAKGVCSKGECLIICEADWQNTDHDLSNGCEGADYDLDWDPNNCGEIGKKCTSPDICNDGECASTCGELEKCGDRCRDTSSDVMNCGSCGNKCPVSDESKHIIGGYCQNKECQIVCAKNWMDEDGDISNGCELNVSFVCGNDVVEKGEACDGTHLNDQTCATVVGEGSTGILSCKPDCMGFDTNGCSKPTTCGNNRIDEGSNEKCDNKALGGNTCESIVGLGSIGYPRCQDNCSDFDTDTCTPATTCGNGAVDDGEACDGDLLQGATCKSVVGVGSQGTIGCAANCKSFDRSGCTAAAVCGNGLLEEGEECDGNNLNGATCESLKGPGSKGQPVCTGCKLDSSNCSAPSTCGNNKKDGLEVCDGNDLDGKSCEALLGPGSTGKISCKDDCMGFNYTCTPPSTCGNDIIEDGEVCDGARLNDKTCADLVGHGADVKPRCNSTCSGYITDDCPASTTCGNGIVEGNEVCDGTKFKNTNVSCDTEVGAGSTGMVLCGADCKSLNLSGCSAPTQCGNGTIDAGEVCEAGKLGSATCASVVGEGSEGNLICGDGCKHFNTTGCSAPHSCGDGNINNGETCDGENVGGKTCADVVGYGSKGTLRCSNKCTNFDTTGCSAAKLCGNGTIDPGEVCDGSMIINATCSSQVGFGSTGKVKCNDTCSGYDLSGCSDAKTCGNGKLDDGELCDGGWLNGATCESVVGFGSTGTLKCNSTCSGFIKTDCSAAKKCGNGVLDGTEKCDTTDLNDATCESVVGVGSTGILLCDSSCNFNTTKCSPSRGCGNGSIEDSEECDTTSFKDGITLCSAYDGATYKSGSLKCSPTCKIDTSECKSYCGNGEVNTSKGEVCDGTNLKGKTCASVVGPGSEGDLACADDCKSFDTSGCSESKYCGDGKINVSGEECDTNSFDIGSDNCAAYSSTYESGRLSCTSNCKVNATACVKKPYCGDGIVNNNELCDDKKFLLNRESCLAWNPDKYVDGSVTCNNDCTLNYGSCVEKPTATCGNNKVEGTEQCDGSNLNGYTCQSWGPNEFGGGTLSCSNCRIDDSKCTPIPACGNGVIDAGEECDGNTTTSCKTYNSSLYASGTLKCTNCMIDTSSCTEWCGNGQVNNNQYVTEACDTAKAVTRTCSAELGTGYSGKLKCASDCKSFDTSECVAPKCNDGEVNQASENCDTNKFRNNKTTCVSWNSTAYTGGNVSCNNDCTINFDACELKPTADCGDGLVNQTSEECDLNDFKNGIKTCDAYDPKYLPGNLGCTLECKIDATSCVEAPVTKCGNGVRDEDEICDKNQFLDDITTCNGYSPRLYASGSLKCTSDCEIDTSECNVHRCGDGIAGPDEYCDKSAFNPDFDTCAEVSSSYSGGSVKCNANCTIDESGCTRKCGNGELDIDELCDHSNSGDKFISWLDTCDEVIPGTTGTLVCTSSCNIDDSGCQAPVTAYCGDGIRNQTTENCDGGDFGAGNTNSCASYNSAYISGTLSCNNNCTINTNNCVLKPTCGNAALDGDEECEYSTSPAQFMFDISTCNEYSSTYASGNLKCTSDCKIDVSECVAKCVDEEFRCSDAGDAVEMCLDGEWETYEPCGSNKYCHPYLAECVDKPNDTVDLQWCSFHWLETTGDHLGYGRILLPSGKTVNDVNAYLACTNDLSKPVWEWDFTDAIDNEACGSDCGDNVEFMTLDRYAGVEGTNYCTFLFEFKNDAGTFACRPIQDGPAAPIIITDTTKLTADLTRQFASSSCTDGSVRCSGKDIQMCGDGEWVTISSCTGNFSCQISGGDILCIANGAASFDITTDMTNLVMSNQTGYSNTRDLGTSPKITLTGAFYVSDHTIDGVTLVLNAKDSYHTQIVIDNLPDGAGIGFVSFKYMTWGGSADYPTLQISDGTTTKTLKVDQTEKYVQTATFTFNNPNATSVTIKPVASSAAARVLIDDIRYTSAN